MITLERLNKAYNTLKDFCIDMEAAGGVVVDTEGKIHPVGDPDWTDIGVTYHKACEVLGRRMKISG